MGYEDLRDYIEIYKKHLSPYPVLLVIPAYILYNHVYLKTDLGRFYVSIDDGIWADYIDKKALESGMNEALDLYKEDPDYIDNFREQFERDTEDFLKFSSSIHKKDLKKLSRTAILKLYNRYNELYINSFVLGEPPAQYLKEALENKIRDDIETRLKDKRKALDILSLLVMPDEETFLTREEKELIKVALGKKSVKKHTEDFAWIPVDYNGEPWTEKDIKKRAGNIKDPNRKLKIIENTHKNIKKRKEKAIIDLKLDKETIRMCRTAGRCITLMDIKKEIYSKAHLHVQPLIKEIARRLKLTTEETNHLLPQEMNSIILGDYSITKKELQERIKRSLYYTKNEEGHAFIYRFVDKKEEEKIRKSLQIKPKNEDELEGICGNPGTIKAKARVIHKTSEFKNMKKGDILVTAYTTPEFVVIMKKASGIITDIGGVTSHASIVAREIDKPCVVGTKNATRLIKDGDILEIEAEEGKVKIIR